MFYKKFCILFLILSNIFITTCKKPSYVTDSTTVPGVPTIGTATAGNGQATVTFTAPTSNGGSSITRYTVTSSPGGFTGTGSSSPITVTGLTNGTAYTFTVTASNAKGTSLPSSASNSVTPSSPVTDIDGNVYNTVTIGTQVWMKENLKTTKYKNGATIPFVTDNYAWHILSTPGYCWYNNDAATYKDTYGALYNSFTVNTGNLCPTGWHVPSDAEWTMLTDYLGGISIAGGKMKETGYVHWTSPNRGATNESNFTALPGGYRDYYGVFNNISDGGFWWSSTEPAPTHAWYRVNYYDDIVIGIFSSSKEVGFSVRCLRD